MIPTEEQYKKAKEVVTAYEDEQKRLELLRVEEFKKDLDALFAKDGWIKEYEIVTGSFSGYDISPEEPCLDECYGGEYDDEIDKLCEKHNVEVSFPSYCYGK